MKNTFKERIPVGQVAVFQVDPRTGTLLDRNNEFAVGDDRQVDLIFAENIEIALSIAKQKVVENPISEWWVTNHLGETKGPFRDEEALAKEVGRRKKDD